MKTIWRHWTGLALGALVLPFVLSANASGAAQTSAQKMWLACQDGRNYPIHPIGVSRENELVTGYLVTTGTGQGVHMRLMPMGNGYRYAGKGIWFDGLRGEAVLNWGSRNEVSCSVVQE